MSEDEIAKLVGFARWVIKNTCFDGGSLDGGDVQDKAEALGLIVSEPYDKEKHGAGPSDMFDVDEGDQIYVFAEFLKE